MSGEIKIQSYENVSVKGNVFTFGDSSEQLATVDKRVFHTLSDVANGWVLERRGGYSTELVDGKLVAVALPISNFDSISAGGADFSDIEKLKAKYEHYVYADGESVLFPKLGVAYLVTPFCTGFEAPRPGVFNKEAVAFSEERLAHYRNLSRVLALNPMQSVSIAGGVPISFGMTQEQVQKCWGEAPLVWDELGGAHRQLKEYRFDRGVGLCYKENKGAVILDQISIIERDGWQVEVDGIRIFQDDKLEQMKAKYEFIESKKKKAVGFPTLGILTVGCGEKKNGGKGADGKYVTLDGAGHDFQFINVYD